jgi:hypothetical protein
VDVTRLTAGEALSIEEMRHEPGESEWESISGGKEPEDGGNQNSTVKQEGALEMDATTTDVYDSDEVKVVPGPEDTNNSSDDETVEYPSWEGNTPKETARVVEKQMWAGMKGEGGGGDNKAGRVPSLAAGQKKN